MRGIISPTSGCKFGINGNLTFPIFKFKDGECFSNPVKIGQFRKNQVY